VPPNGTTPANGTELERAARGNGFKINRTTINEIRNGTYRARPGRPVLEPSPGLLASPSTPPTRPPTCPSRRTVRRGAPDDIDQLTREERDTVLHLARVFLNHHRRES